MARRLVRLDVLCVVCHTCNGKCQCTKSQYPAPAELLSLAAVSV